MQPGIKLFIFTIVSLSVIALLFILCKIFVKKQEHKNVILKASALITVLVHYSSLYVDYFTTKSAMVDSTMLIAVYPCNICMWLLLISAFIKSDNTFSKLLVEFTAIGGFVCGFIGLAFNENFIANPSLKDYDILKGLLSHVTMLFGTMYLFEVRNVKIRVKSNMLSTLLGLSIFAIQGLLVNTLFKVFDLGEVNAMFMLYPPFENAKFINFYTVGIAALLFMFLISSIYEFIFIKKEDRWYNNIGKKQNF